MKKIPSEPELELLVSKLKLEIKSLEDRLIDKDKLIDSLRYDSSKLINQIERLTSIMEHQHRQGVSSRDTFLLKKAAHIISNFESRTDYEENTIENISKSRNVNQKLASFDPASTNSPSNEIDFYRNVDAYNFTSKQTVESQKTEDKNPFQKTIDRIRVSDQKPHDSERSRPPTNSILTDSRGDQLDEFINRNIGANPDSTRQSISNGNKQVRKKKKPY
tara:strand:+ start:2162 stop:2818 length:657 start_codon:yes stop_codon:yes gene_type:complete